MVSDVEEVLSKGLIGVIERNRRCDDEGQSEMFELRGSRYGTVGLE